MEDVSLKELINYFKSKIIFIIIIFILVFFLTCFLLNIKAKKENSYVSSFSFFTQSVDEKALINIDNTITYTYEEILRSRAVLNTVIENLELNMKFETLKQQIEISDMGKVILVKVNNKDKKIVEEISREIIHTLENQIEKYNFEDKIVMLDEIEVSSVNTMSKSKILLYSALISIFGSIAIVYSAFYLKKIVKIFK